MIPLLQIIPGPVPAPHPSGGLPGEIAWIALLAIAAFFAVGLIFPRRPPAMAEHELPEPGKWADDTRLESLEKRARENGL